jgi:hypothetical protein
MVNDGKVSPGLSLVSVALSVLGDGVAGSSATSQISSVASSARRRASAAADASGV